MTSVSSVSDSHAPSSLPIVPTLREALLLIVHHWHFVGSLIVGPIVLMTLVQMPILWMDPQTSATSVMQLADATVSAMLLTTLAISWHRFILLEDQSVSPIQFWRWRARETWFALYGLGIGFTYTILGLLVIFIASAAEAFIKEAPVWLHTILGALTLIALLGVCGHFCGPLSLILPATAIDRRPSGGWSSSIWVKAQGNEWPLAVLVVMIPIPALLLLSKISETSFAYAREASPLLGVGVLMLMCTLYLVATIAQVGVLSLAYKALFPVKETPT